VTRIGKSIPMHVATALRRLPRWLLWRCPLCGRTAHMKISTLGFTSEHPRIIASPETISV
jgi:hypothetical protein